jgi:uncharacterized repeat protein (TIGR03803 family)
MGLLAPLAAHAVTVTTLYQFKGGTDASEPNGTLLYEAGLLYGVSLRGGATGNGTVFSINAATGVEQVLYSFKGGADGAAPYGALVLVGERLFGTTSQGGAHGDGAVFVISIKTGAERLVHSFGGQPDGREPVAGLSYNGGMLYGTTEFGGVNNGGTVFSVSPITGTEQVLHSFGSNDGFYPESPVTPVDGNLYGTTIYGGNPDEGTVFKLNVATKTATVLYSFMGKQDGAAPVGGLIYTNGLLYGTTTCMDFCQTGVYGTAFNLNPTTGALTTLHEFDNLGDGSSPTTRLLAYHGAILGMASGMGTNGFGDATMFAMPDAYTGLITLYTFPEESNTGLRYVNGAFYGTTLGYVFKLTL